MIISGSDREGEVAPADIRHGLDAMLTPEGDAFEFHYNYLVYTFRQNDEEVVAKHYMDRPGEVSVLKSVSLPLSDFMHGVLIFLGLRYAKIDILSDTGYASLPDDIRSAIAEGVMRRFKGYP